MSYMISNSGHLQNTNPSIGDEIDPIEFNNAVKNRICELETLVKEGCELEIDYDNETNKWYAANYNETNAESTFITNNNTTVVAFADIDNNRLTKALNELDVYYVP